ncbi:unnamed protein product [Caenorhabditis sp. 36 PRJEB53466]|nr:unnamed protein product [Caenorhabditis sp. 36 PRJEB53466]
MLTSRAKDLVYAFFSSAIEHLNADLRNQFLQEINEALVETTDSALKCVAVAFINQYNLQLPGSQPVLNILERYRFEQFDGVLPFPKWLSYFRTLAVPADPICCVLDEETFAVTITGRAVFKIPHPANSGFSCERVFEFIDVCAQKGVRQIRFTVNNEIEECVNVLRKLTVTFPQNAIIRQQEDNIQILTTGGLLP